MGDGSKYRVLVVGCGGMSRTWLSVAAQMDNIEIVGLVDLDKDAALARADQYDLPADATYAVLEQALTAQKPDVVFDVTVPAAHDKTTIAALQAGAHVLGEKPLAVSMDRARAMVKAADDAGKMYAVMQNRRWLKSIRQVKALLRTGQLGAIQEVHADFYVGAHFGGFRAEMEHPLLVDMAIHTFDQGRFLCEAEPKAVYCHSFNPKHSWYQGDASAVAIYEMTRGITLTYRGSWCADGLNTPWEANWRIICENGTLTWSGDKIIAEVPESGEQEGLIHKMRQLEVPDYDLPYGGHDGCIRSFFEHLDAGTTPETDCHDNIHSLAMMLGAVESAAKKARVNIAGL